MRRTRTGRRIVASLATTLAVIAGLPLAGPAQASSLELSTEGHRTDRPRAEFDVTATLCPVVGEVDSSRHRDRTTWRGPAVASIGLLTGELTVTGPSDALADRARSQRLRWQLEPTASNGRVEGSAIVSRRGQVRWIGRGRGALAGVVVRARTSVTMAGPAADGSCDDGLLIEGSGSARGPRSRAPWGAVEVISTKDFATSVADLTAAIEANPNLTLVRTVDHQAAAASRNLALGPTTELFFGNPAIGTPLMQDSQVTGIDLPQKILVWEDPLGTVRVAYNAPAYLQSRHAIGGSEAQLTTVANALAGLTSVATGTEVQPVFDAGQVRPGAGLVTVESSKSPEQAFADITAALEAAPPVNIAIELEHDANAARIGLDLDPTKLVVFGNPSLGTGLMRTDQSVALDLPQKMLVWAGPDGQTRISWNDPHWVARRHRIGGHDDLLDTLAGALATFASAGQ